MSHIQEYASAVEAMNEWTAEKQRRKNQLRDYFTRQGRDETSISFLIDQDQVVKECQIMLDRATARAAALGPAALLESQGLL